MIEWIWYTSGSLVAAHAWKCWQRACLQIASDVGASELVLLRFHLSAPEVTIRFGNEIGTK